MTDRSPAENHTDWTPAELQAVIESSPTRPRIEYVPRHLANRIKCDCPRVRVDVEPDTHVATLFDAAVTPWAVKILHRQPGHERVDLTEQPAAEPVAPPEPGVEYLRPGTVRCDCPRHVNSASAAPVIVMRHRPGCEERHPGLATAPPPAPRVPPGVIPCPAEGCGEVAFSAGSRPGERRCHRCGHVWEPGRPALAVLPGTDQPRRARAGRPALLSTDAEEAAI